MKRSWLVLLMLAVLGSTGAAGADVLTQSRLDQVSWATKSNRILLPDLLLKWDRWMHTAVADVTALKAVAAADRYHGMVTLVVAGADGAPHLYGFHGTSTASNDNDKVVAGNAGAGRWLRLDDIVDGSISLDDLGANDCAANQVIKRNAGGTAWECAADVDTDTDTTYTAGSGLALTEGAFSLLMTCSENQILKWNGTAWACAADVDTDTDTTYTAGSGLALTEGAFSLLTTCSSGQVLRWNGTAWACADTIESSTASDGDGDDSITLNAQSGQVTTKSLTTAGSSEYTLTVVNSWVASASTPIALNMTALGSNTAGEPLVLTTTAGTGQFVTVIKNVDEAALNGTLTLSFIVGK
jgi:hypothetical protein